MPHPSPLPLPLPCHVQLVAQKFVSQNALDDLRIALGEEAATAVPGTQVVANSTETAAVHIFLY